jgi:ParB family chromosome partitioning protein
MSNKSTKKRPASPLSAMSNMDFSQFEETETSGSNNVLLVDPKKIQNWSFHDRPEAELGDIQSLAKEFKDPNIGQQQPCIVRPIKSDTYNYEVIAGERRWRAALLANINLAVIVKDLDDSKAAYCQIAENHNRKDLSEYSIGMSLATLIEHNFLKQKDLQEKFNLSAVQINRYLSFSQLTSEMKEAIGELNLVSARTAAEIRSLWKKGSIYQDALIQLGEKIATGKLGEKLLKREIDKIINSNEPKAKISARKFFKGDNTLAFTVVEKPDSLNIKFPKEILAQIDKEELYEILKERIYSKTE